MTVNRNSLRTIVAAIGLTMAAGLMAPLAAHADNDHDSRRDNHPYAVRQNNGYRNYHNYRGNRGNHYGMLNRDRDHDRDRDRDRNRDRNRDRDRDHDRDWHH